MKADDPESHFELPHARLADHHLISRIDLGPCFPTDHRPHAQVDLGQANHRWSPPVDLVMNWIPKGSSE